MPKFMKQKTVKKKNYRGKEKKKKTKKIKKINKKQYKKRSIKQKGGNIDTIEEYERQLEIEIEKELKLLFPLGGEMKEDINYLKVFIDNLNEKYKTKIKHSYDKLKNKIYDLDKAKANVIYTKMYEYYQKILFISFIYDQYVQLKYLPENLLLKYNTYNIDSYALMEELHKIHLSTILLIRKYENEKLELSNTYIKTIKSSKKSIFNPEDYKFKTYLVSMLKNNNIHETNFIDIPIIPPIYEKKLEQLDQFKKKDSTLVFDYNYFKTDMYDNPSYKIISIILNINDKIIGYRYASIHADGKGKYYASNKSYIEIDTEYRGKGLCTPFTSYAYTELMKFVDRIELIIVSDSQIIACMCYIKSALSLGNVDIYAKSFDEEPFQIKTIEQCNRIENRTNITITKR